MQKKPTLVEEAYKFLCKNKKADLKEILKHVKKQCNIAKEDEEKAGGDLYTAMIFDPNFFLKNDKIWYPRSEVSQEEIKEQMTRIDLPTNKDDTSEMTIDLIITTDLTKTLDDEEFDEDDTIGIKIVEDNYDE
ncbi:hypothetical protein [Spiroplasma endosymbiont of Nebria brevicollis]|uniref:hypothetical protein n=1 Tax=Spiroplasma endosymbiont of Nebria brevicollis TaxID=3066284 RepID=UPI00313BAAFE